MQPDLFSRVFELVSRRDVIISEHGYEELAADNLSVSELLTGISDARLVEEYPEYHKGPCVLLLQRDQIGAPVHVLWGIPAGASSPAVLITAYLPDTARWTSDFLRRKPKS